MIHEHALEGNCEYSVHEKRPSFTDRNVGSPYIVPEVA